MPSLPAPAVDNSPSRPAAIQSQPLLPSLLCRVRTENSRSRTRWQSHGPGYSPSDDSSGGLPGGEIGVEITYFSEAQLHISRGRQRSMQNGKSGLPAFASFLQIGHFMDAPEY